MKKYLLSFIAMTFFVMSVFTQDIPPATSDATDLPSGSYVIAMDNVLQSNGTTFNLYSYGLVTYLLNNNVRVRWVISSTKAKDGIDFSVTASRIKPTAAAAALRDFRSGPFVIFAADLPANINTLIDAYNALSTTGTAVNVYQTTALAAAVPVRYDYKSVGSAGVIWKPKAALLNDGNNWTIHRQYLYDAGIRFGQVGDNATNWRLSGGLDLAINCFTIATEAHWKEDAPSASQIIIMNTVKTFMLNGGNFLAECAAVRTYENYFKFHSTGGINTATENDFSGASSLVVYPNPALSYSQFHGAVNFNNSGSLKNWAYLGSLQNNEHDHAKAPSTGTGANNIGASVSRIKGSSPGGLAFYLGAHEYVSSTTLDIVNGKRMYLNAFLTPTDPQGSLKTAGFIVCNNPVTAPVSIISAPANAYPFSFSLWRETNSIAGLQKGVGPGFDTQEGSTLTIASPSSIPQGGTITGSFQPPSANTYYLAKTPAAGCFQEVVDETPCSTLPVTLLSFSAQRNSNNVNLSWETATEENNKGYYIQRKDGSKDWEEVGFVSSKAANGNSNSRLAYQYSDINAEAGITQYKLKQVDIDGRISHSNIRSVRGIGQSGRTVVYPNPSNNGTVNILFEGANIVRDITIYDVSGRIIKQLKKESSNTIQVENLVPGFYSVRIVNTETGKQEVEKIIVNKR